MYWWVTTVSPGGKLVILGPYSSEEDANEYGFSHFSSNFEVEQTAVKDQAEVTRIMKKKRYDTINNLDQALQRARHQLPKEKGGQINYD